jgi:hypothetical protein
MNGENCMEIKLSNWEALVLEDVLAKLEQTSGFQEIDMAGRMVLYKIHALLEQGMEELFDPNYQKILHQAREEVMKSLGA